MIRYYRFTPAWLACVLMVSPFRVLAEADGPDHYAVRDVAADDVLNLREAPNRHSHTIAGIPPDGDCLRNLGCVGGLTYQEFATLPEAEKGRIERQRPRWCKVEYQGVIGWVAGRYLRESYCGPQLIVPVPPVRVE